MTPPKEFRSWSHRWRRKAPQAQLAITLGALLVISGLFFLASYYLGGR